MREHPKHLPDDKKPDVTKVLYVMFYVTCKLQEI